MKSDAHLHTETSLGIRSGHAIGPIAVAAPWHKFCYVLLLFTLPPPSTSRELSAVSAVRSCSSMARLARSYLVRSTAETKSNTFMLATSMGSHKRGKWACTGPKTTGTEPREKLAKSTCTDLLL